MTASDIAARRFASATDGYDPKEVRAFLARVSQHIGRLNGEIEGQRARIKRLETQLGVGQKDAYERLSREVAAVLAAAEEAGERIRQQAEDEAARLRRETEEEAVRMRLQAEDEIERVRRESEVEAERTRAEFQADGDRVRRDAQQRARDVVSAAGAEAGAILSRARQTEEAVAARAHGVPDRAAAAVATKSSVEAEIEALHRQLGSLASMMREIHLPTDGPRLEPWTRNGEESDVAADDRGGAPAT